MKIKKVKIGLKDIKTSLNDFVKSGEAIKKGEIVKKEKSVYFTSLEAFRKAITSPRLELLRTIKEKNPSSINRLAQDLNRNIKNVSDDVSYLAQIGLIETRKTNKEVPPYVEYDKILLEITV